MIRTILAMEIRRFLVTPGFWVLTALMQAGLAWLFFVHLDGFIDLQPRIADTPGAPGVTELVAAPTLMDAAVLLMLAAPLLAMRSLSEERKTRSLLLLQAAPVSDWQIVWGKFLGLSGLLLLPVITAVVMILSLYAGTNLDGGRLATATAGLVATVCLISSAGVWISATTRHPAIAAGLLYGLFLMLWLAQSTAQPASADTNLVHWIALPTHLEPMMAGRLRASDLLYFVTMCSGFLLLARITLGRLRGDGA